MTWLASLLDLLALLAFGAFMAAGGWVARDVSNARRFRRVAESVRAERMGP